MGNDQKKTQSTLEHAIYGKTKQFEQNGQKFHTVSFPIKQLNQGQTFIKDVKQTQTFNKKHLLIGSEQKVQKSGLCGDSGLLNTNFPFYPHTLQNQIQRRRQQGNKFLNRQQLLNLIYQIIDGAKNFDRTQYKIGDLRPSRILLDQNKKNIKILNHFTSPNQLTGLERVLEEDNKDKALLAPEQLKALVKKVSNPQINLHKADSFSLGLTILSIGNLKKMQNQLYDFSNNNSAFSWTQLSIQLQNFQRRYGHFFAEVIKGFVQNEPRNRLYIGEVGFILQYYEKNIYQMSHFQPDYSLMQKSYEKNYSGLKSQGFSNWLNSCKSYTLTSNKPLVSPPPMKKQITTTVVNSNVRFTYVSPSSVKAAQNENLKY